MNGCVKKNSMVYEEKRVYRNREEKENFKHDLVSVEEKRSEGRNGRSRNEDVEKEKGKIGGKKEKGEEGRKRKKKGE